MGFASVYRCLQELFPQLDARLLKAVAIENSKDADAAVEVVLSDILPRMTENENPPSFPQGNFGTQSHMDEEVQEEDVGSLLRRHRSAEKLNASESKVSVNADGYASSSSTNDPAPVSEAHFWDANESIDQSHEAAGHEDVNASKTAEETRGISLRHISRAQLVAMHHFNVAKAPDELYGTAESEELILLGMMNKPPRSMGQTSFLAPSFIADVNDSGNGEGRNADSENEHQDKNEELFPENLDCPVLELVAVQKHAPEADRAVDVCAEYLKDIDSAADAGYVPSGVQEHVPEADRAVNVSAEYFKDIDTAAEVDRATSAVQNHAPEADREVDVSAEYLKDIDIAAEACYATSALQFSGNEALNMTRSAQIGEVDLLEQIIEDAKNNKRTLFSAMESVIDTMREVEEQERAAEQAREEAARRSSDVCRRVEELKRMIQSAKEANDMHAGEVYGERAILATEVRELQSRLLSLSDERNSSLAILDEMRNALETRFAAAEEVREAAEREKHAKVESAANALKEQEALMEKVVHESKVLQEEAEENSKLREFLMDRGRVVDQLQGEIAVICQDVKLLKERFNSGVALGKSISFGQTSCILASSSSSLHSSASSDRVPGNGETPKPPNEDRLGSSVGGSSPPRKEPKDEKEELSDEGWELCEN